MAKLKFNPEKLWFHYDRPLSSSGMESNIYSVGNGLVGKCLKGEDFLLKGDSVEEILNYEDRVSQELFKGRISVPQPYGVFLIRERNTGEFFPTFVMQKIFSLEPFYWSLKDIRKIEEDSRLEIEKAKSLGFIPSLDSGEFANVIYGKIDPSFKRNKVFLNDFRYWKNEKLGLIPPKPMIF